MDLLRGNRRLFFYCLSLAVLLAMLAAALGAIARTGAFLTGQDDWQGLAGEYRIGVIDYVVEVNDQHLLGLEEGESKTYKLAVPMLGAVRMFDPTVSGDLRVKEFNEGVTLLRVRVVNHSDSMVDVTAAFQAIAATGPEPIRFLPLPTELSAAAVQTLNYRQYVMDALAPHGLTGTAGLTESHALTKLDTAYTAYMDARQQIMTLPVGILAGAVPHGQGTGDFVTNGSFDYQYRDIFLIAWTEYAGAEYNLPQSSAAPTRQAELAGTFTVGQLE